jgi:hypothetical protein
MEKCARKKKRGNKKNQKKDLTGPPLLEISGNPTIPELIGSVSLPSQLFQQTVHFDFTSRAKVNASMNDYRDHKSRRQGGAVAFAVLF